MVLADFFNAELLSEIFSEFEDLDFESWVSENQIDFESMSDSQVFNLLPSGVKELFSDIDMNDSWNHGGM